MGGARLPISQGRAHGFNSQSHLSSAEVGKGERGKGVRLAFREVWCVRVCVLRKLRRGAEWVVPNYLLSPSTRPSTRPPTLQT